MRRRGRLEVWLKLTQSHAQDNRGRKRTFSQSLLLFDPEQKWLTASFAFTIFTFFEQTRFAFFLQIFCAHFSILAKFEICAKILALCVITSPLLGLLHRWPWNQEKNKIWNRPWQILFHKCKLSDLNIFSRWWLRSKSGSSKKCSKSIGSRSMAWGWEGGDTNPQDMRDDSDAGKWCWRQVNRGASNLVMIGGDYVCTPPRAKRDRWIGFLDLGESITPSLRR